MVYNTHIFPYHHLLIFKLIIVSKWLQCLPKQIWEKWAKTHPSLLPSFWCFYFLSNFKRSPKSSKVPSLDYPRPTFSPYYQASISHATIFKQAWIPYFWDIFGSAAFVFQVHWIIRENEEALEPFITGLN